jgi:putative hydrolase of the HAD superfamily
LNFVFDLGGVLISYEPKKYVEKLLDNDTEMIYRLIFESPEWIELDRGTISEDRAIEIWCKRKPEYSEYIRLVMKNWIEMLVPVDENVLFLKFLKKKGHRLYVLSNFHKKAFEILYEKYDFFSLFDGLVISYREKTVKPEEKIYRILLERFGLIPSETVFIDDSPKNIEAAQKIGLNTFLYRNHLELKKFLNKFLGGAIVEA